MSCATPLHILLQCNDNYDDIECGHEDNGDDDNYDDNYGHEEEDGAACRVLPEREFN